MEEGGEGEKVIHIINQVDDKIINYNDILRKELKPTLGCPSHEEASNEIEYNHAKPAHYELWDGMKDTFAIHKGALTKEEFGGFLKGNILKYKLRIGDKPDTPVERDMAKITIYREEYRKFNNEK